MKIAIAAVLLGYAAAAKVFGWPCPILYWTGIPCPGCGMTRALTAALRGAWREALEYHAMVWSLPLLAAVFLTDGRIFRTEWKNRLLIALLGIGFVLTWIGRLF